MILHTYFRSGASWRVRIALALKGLDVQARPHNLRTGQQRDPAYLEINPQGLLPALELDDGAVITQSLAIMGYLEAIRPDPPLLPAAPLKRAQVQAFALSIACDIHPVQNLKVLQRVRALASDEAATHWARDVISEGLDASEKLLSKTDDAFCFGDAPSLADIVLVPQLVNARRFGADIPPRLSRIEAHCMTLPAFRQTRPDAQPDATPD